MSVASAAASQGPAGPSLEQIRAFRLHSHHLDADCRLNTGCNPDTAGQKTLASKLAGACGLQNTPPGAWETALYNRAPSLNLADMERMLYREKSLIQAFSFRGAPVIFPVSESDVFLSALIPEKGEPWIYTPGIAEALAFLQMPFEELFGKLKEVIPRLDETTILSKNTLDQTLAQWMIPLLPDEKRKLWNQPSMYGSPDRQTVGGAVVSFLLRPCAFSGLVVFGERKGISPSFTSYQNWTGHSLLPREDAGQKLARKFLHCYGPATVDSFASWLGCSGKQARRLWSAVSGEIEPTVVLGKKAYFLSVDRQRLFSPASLDEKPLLLGGHDPFLDQRDRSVLLPDPSLHRQIWKLVSNPGAILRRGEIAGTWTSKKKGKGMEIKMTLFPSAAKSLTKQTLLDSAEEYAAFRRLNLMSVGMEYIRHT